MQVLSHARRSERCRTTDHVSGVIGDSDTLQPSTPQPILTMRAMIPRLFEGRSREESMGFACSAPSSGPLPDYDHKLSDEGHEVVRMRRTNSGDIGVGDITNMSCLGLSDEGHQAALYYQWTTSDPHTGLIVGLAPDQTLRLCRQGPFIQRRVKISQSTNT